VKSEFPSKVRSSVIGISVALHVALGLGAVFTPKSKRVEKIAVAVFEKEKQEKQEEPKKEVEPPRPPPPPPPRQAKALPEAPKAETPEEPEAKAEEAPEPPRGLGTGYEGYADLGGLSLGGSGEGGMAVRSGPPRAASKKDPPKPTVVKKETALVPTVKDECAEPLSKPKPSTTAAVVYPETARRAEVEGVVRVKITVDEKGRIMSAEVVRGLGYGLDEAALEAARKWTFAPATRCGKPTTASLTVAMRFSLGA
jgi:periplasmic protein TonB